MRLGTKVLSNSRIQFASNESKLVPRKLDPGPSSKVDLFFVPRCKENICCQLRFFKSMP
jgi:hypothetical protein